VEIIAGVDEAGRGPLAGPVVAAAVVLPEDHDISGLRDSKRLTPRRREQLFHEIYDKAKAVSVGVVDVLTIDRLNILQATYKAMQMALGRLYPSPTRALIDGRPLPSQVIPNKGIVKGDDQIPSIMAASIIAKVTRDRMMEQYDLIFPGYGFAKHKGYGTAEHMQALKELKACLIHRRSFHPVPQHLPTLSWLRRNRRVGSWGEQLAALKLLEQGYSIRAMNVVCGPHGELDIIADNEQELVFVEVKTATREQMGVPELKVDDVKRRRWKHAIQYYLTEQPTQKDIRMDVFSIILGKGRPRIKHYRGVRWDE